MDRLTLPAVGESAKVWLEGESPFADCVAILDDNSWVGRIANKLIPEFSDDEWKYDFPKPIHHNFRRGDIVHFVQDENVWKPAREFAA